jgi:hypothetical protein
VVPAYILVWLIAIYYSGGYDKPLKILSFLKGHLVGTLFILVIYALLPIDWRFSRALIFLGSLWAILSTMGLRLLFHLLKVKDYEIDLNKQMRMVIVGKKEEVLRVSKLLLDTQARPEIIGSVSPESGDNKPSDGKVTSDGYMGRMDQIDEIVAINRVDEIVFCSKDLPSQEIIRVMTRLIGSSVDFKIAPPESLSIIGSNSINTAGDLYTIHFNSIGKDSNQRNKRLFDAVMALPLLLTFPLWFLFVKGHFRSVGNTLRVLLGMRTWVGYLEAENIHQSDMPRLKRGILHPGMHLPRETLSNERIKEINVVYAKDYKVLNDLLIITRNFREI